MSTKSLTQYTCDLCGVSDTRDAYLGMPPEWMALNGNLTDGPVIHVCPAQARILREALGVYQAAKTAFIGACATQAAGRYDGAKIARELVLDDAIARSHQDESMTAEERIAALLKDNVGLTMPDLVAAVKPETPAPAGPANDVKPDAPQTTQKPADAPPATEPQAKEEKT